MCISRFSNRKVGTKDPLSAAADLFGDSLDCTRKGYAASVTLVPRERLRNHVAVLLAMPRRGLFRHAAFGRDHQYVMSLTKTKNPNAFPIGNKFGFFIYGGRYRTRTYDLPHVKRLCKEPCNYVKSCFFICAIASRLASILECVYREVVFIFVCPSSS